MILEPRNKDEIFKNLKYLDPDDLLIYSSQKRFLVGVIKALNNGGKC